MINFENNIIVSFNGCEVFNDKVEKDDAYILETARMRHDPYYLFCAKIKINFNDFILKNIEDFTKLLASAN